MNKSPVFVNATHALAGFASELKFEMIPSEITEHAKLCILDSLACGLYGSTLPWSEILYNTLKHLDNNPKSVVLGKPYKLSDQNAVLANGAFIHAFELDDLHPQSIVHPGSVVLPAIFAAIRYSNKEVTGRDLITALVAGYEVASRVGMAVGAAHLIQGFHPTGTHGTLGAAASAGKIMDLNLTQMHDALGIAGTQAAGLMCSQFESMVKRFHAGRAAQSGFLSVALGRDGYVGIKNLLESEYGGYLGTLSTKSFPELLTGGLGTVWETGNVGFKPYSTNGSCHPAIDIVLDFISKDEIDIADVESVKVIVSTATKEHVGWEYTPDTVTTAQMNLPYIISVVLADHDAFVDQFNQERIIDQNLVAFSKRVSVEASKEIDLKGDSYRHETHIKIILKSGRVLEGSRIFAKGSRKLPLTTEEVISKAEKLLLRSAQARNSNRIIEQVLEIDKLASLSSFIDELGDN